MANDKRRPYDPDVIRLLPRSVYGDRFWMVLVEEAMTRDYSQLGDPYGISEMTAQSADQDVEGVRFRFAVSPSLWMTQSRMAPFT